MTNSATAGIKEAPERENCSRQIFKNFRDATVAMINCDETPKGIDEAIDRMLDYFNNELGGADEDAAVNAYRVMSNVFGLDDGGEETPPLAPTPGHYNEVRAEEFTLVDDVGNVRARLHVAGNDAVLSMRDSQGRPRLQLRAGDEEAMITIYGERGEWGKGVLPATDEVERVKVGYDSAEQHARIVIRDGNERECVSAEVFDGDPADGTIRLINPADGNITIIDSDGLIAENGAGDLVVDCRGRRAAAPAPKPTPAGSTVRNGAGGADWRDRVLSEEEAAGLAERLFPEVAYTGEADQIAAVVFRIADLLTYEDDPQVREASFDRIARAIYSRTANSCEAFTSFAEAAGAKFGRAA
jgi:hypothetical protein